MDRQFLIFDADDTLWENNIYFERAFDAFAEYLAHASLAPQQVRDVLDEIEAANNKIHGYGTLNFARNLRQCYEHLAERDVSEADLKTVVGFAEQILECPMEVIEGVPETLARFPKEVDLACLQCFDLATGKFLWQYSSEKLPAGRVHDWPQIGLCSTPCVVGKVADLPL